VLRIFRSVALIEGVSYLLLFALSMPLKYWADIREPNIYIGYLHGFLFMAYIALALVLWQERKWSLKTLFWILLASLLPFGTFYLDSRFLKAQPASVR
jgi:integral membrane protein